MARNAEAREPLAQFPGFDVDEPFISGRGRQPGTARLPEEVGLRRDDEVLRRLVAGNVEAAHDGDRDTVELAEDELRGAGYLVGDGDTRRVELVARRILLSVEDAERLDAGGADRDVRRAGAPRAPERVGDDHAHRPAGALAQLVAQARRGAVGIDREQDERFRLRRVRRVDTGRAADEPVLRASDQERRPGADELDGLVEDHLNPARVGVGGELARLLRRLDIRERDDAPLHLRDRLLRDDDDVAVLEVDPLDDHGGEIVSLAQLGQARDGRDGEAAHALEYAGARERAGIERAAGHRFGGELERERLRVGVVPADEGVLVRASGGELRRRERLETRDDRAGDELLRPFREGQLLGGAKVTRNAEHRRRADRAGESRGGIERYRGVRREDDELDVRDGVLVRGAPRCADLVRLLLRTCRVTGAEHDLVARLDEPGREREAEVARAADDRDLQAGTAPSATSARRRRASSSLISVRVTIGRTSPSPSRSSVSASSTTIASIRPS